MHQTLNISLSQQTIKEIKTLSRERGFATVSDYIKYLIELDSDLISETELLDSIREARKEYREGRAIKVESIKDLL